LQNKNQKGKNKKRRKPAEQPKCKIKSMANETPQQTPLASPLKLLHRKLGAAGLGGTGGTPVKDRKGNNPRKTFASNKAEQKIGSRFWFGLVGGVVAIAAFVWLSSWKR
jgi:hypothetical protein